MPTPPPRILFIRYLIIIYLNETFCEMVFNFSDNTLFIYKKGNSIWHQNFAGLVYIWITWESIRYRCLLWLPLLILWLTGHNCAGRARNNRTGPGIRLHKIREKIFMRSYINWKFTYYNQNCFAMLRSTRNAGPTTAKDRSASGVIHVLLHSKSGSGYICICTGHKPRFATE